MLTNHISTSSLFPTLFLAYSYVVVVVRMPQHSRKMSLLLCETVRLRRKYREVSQLYIKLVSEVQ